MDDDDKQKWGIVAGILLGLFLSVVTVMVTCEAWEMMKPRMKTFKKHIVLTNENAALKTKINKDYARNDGIKVKLVKEEEEK